MGNLEWIDLSHVVCQPGIVLCSVLEDEKQELFSCIFYDTSGLSQGFSSLVKSSTFAFVMAQTLCFGGGLIAVWWVMTSHKGPRR